MVRDWGPWSKVKLDALERYLAGFAIASRAAKGTLYLDLCAGAIDNSDRETGKPIEGSARRALRVTPEFAKLAFCELSKPIAAALDRALREEFPGRDFTVIAQDCNVAIPAFLEALEPGWRWAPTFAFLDQYSTQIQWSTVEYLSKWKAQGRTKVEQWIYFGESFYPRGLRLKGSEPNSQAAQQLDAMFGNDEWRTLMAMREDDVLDGLGLKKELTNLYRWQLEEHLGYKTTIPIEISNTHGQVIYTLIFATDHDAGSRIMESVHGRTREQLAAMKGRAKEKRARQRRFDNEPDALFDGSGWFAYSAEGEAEEIPFEAFPPAPPLPYHRKWNR